METLLFHPFFGIIITIIFYAAGTYIRKKFPSPFLNPLLIATVLLILLFSFTPITLEQYEAGGNVISMFIVPATVVLALSMYFQWDLLKKNILPIIAGCLAGSAASLFSVWGMCRLFEIDEQVRFSLLPKSVTTAIALELSEQKGGIPSITVFAVILTGIISMVLSPFIIRLFRLKNPVAVGVALGTSGHALATTKALEIGETEGAMSGISLVLAGVLTSILFLIFFR